MFPSIRARLEAHRLSRKLHKSLAASEDKWKIDTNEKGYPTLSTGDFQIELVPRSARLFDAVHVYSAGTEIWLPLFARLRLRAATRWRLLQYADEHWTEP